MKKNILDNGSSTDSDPVAGQEPAECEGAGGGRSCCSRENNREDDLREPGTGRGAWRSQ